MASQANPLLDALRGRNRIPRTPVKSFAGTDALPNSWGRVAQAKAKISAAEVRTRIGDIAPWATRKPQIYDVKLQIGAHGLPDGHQWAHLFKQADGMSNPVAMLEVAAVVSRDPKDPNPATARVSEVRFNTRGTNIDDKTSPGHHLTIVNTSQNAGFSARVPEVLRRSDLNARDRLTLLDESDRAKLATAPIRNYSLASPAGGDQVEQGKSAHTVTILVRRQEGEEHEGLCSDFLVKSRPGDVVMAGVPMGHTFVGPNNDTPALFFGIGTSVSPYRAMLATRGRDPARSASTRLYMGHRTPELEHFGEELRCIASAPQNNAAYMPVFSAQPEDSRGMAHLDDILKHAGEARQMFIVILQPDFHIYISGKRELREQILAGLKMAALELSPILGEVIARRLTQADEDGRIHVEGTVAREVPMPLQGA